MTNRKLLALTVALIASAVLAAAGTAEAGCEPDASGGWDCWHPPSSPAKHSVLKRYMLSLVNAERQAVGAPAVELGHNRAAQDHADASLANCYSGHWGMDGLKPHMRYALAGGTQFSSENVVGKDYCHTVEDGFRPIRIREWLDRAMTGLMGSPGHARNLLNPDHRRLNLGLAWGRYNGYLVQQFEGDYVAFTTLPSFDEDGVLELAGTLRNLPSVEGLSVSVYYHLTPRPLTRGQVSRTYCVGLDMKVAQVLRPPRPGHQYSEDEGYRTGRACVDPYTVSPLLPGPSTAEEARSLWEAAKAFDAYWSHYFPYVVARRWELDGEAFAIAADLRHVLRQHGAGVYTVTVAAEVDDQWTRVAKYPIFHSLKEGGAE